MTVKQIPGESRLLNGQSLTGLLYPLIDKGRTLTPLLIEVQKLIDARIAHLSGQREAMEKQPTLLPWAEEKKRLQDFCKHLKGPALWHCNQVLLREQSIIEARDKVGQAVFLFDRNCWDSKVEDKVDQEMMRVRLEFHSQKDTYVLCAEKPRKIADLLLTANGQINHGLVNWIKTYFFDGGLLEYEQGILCVLDQIDLPWQKIIDGIEVPARDEVLALVRTDLRLKAGEPVTKRHCQRAALGGLFSLMAQGPAGDCFAVAWKTRTHREFMLDALQDYADIVGKGCIERNGRSFSFEREKGASGNQLLNAWEACLAALGQSEKEDPLRKRIHRCVLGQLQGVKKDRYAVKELFRIFKTTMNDSYRLVVDNEGMGRGTFKLYQRDVRIETPGQLKKWIEECLDIAANTALARSSSEEDKGAVRGASFSMALLMQREAFLRELLYAYDKENREVKDPVENYRALKSSPMSTSMEFGVATGKDFLPDAQAVRPKERLRWLFDFARWSESEEIPWLQDKSHEAWVQENIIGPGLKIARRVISEEEKGKMKEAPLTLLNKEMTVHEYVSIQKLDAIVLDALSDLPRIRVKGEVFYFNPRTEKISSQLLQ